ncbi:hypothetical protein B0T14DRAFT_92407 [Immersiella caudata]|uniref:Secreted protein n=1 Tax=Immersiella caudata TaxID=314043 RepID=A0AA39X313_9PEZI|nr:hypothetical protein B0T14DRAFT_92407 [Immersiella caudata]
MFCFDFALWFVPPHRLVWSLVLCNLFSRLGTINEATPITGRYPPRHPSPDKKKVLKRRLTGSNSAQHIRPMYLPVPPPYITFYTVQGNKGAAVSLGRGKGRREHNTSAPFRFTHPLCRGKYTSGCTYL